MEFMLDTANLADIKKFADFYRLRESLRILQLLKNEGKTRFFPPHERNSQASLENTVHYMYK